LERIVRGRPGFPSTDTSIMLSVINLADKLGLIQDRWNPRIVAQVDDTHVKLVKIQGDFVWHSHEHEDELFLVLHGRLDIELRDGVVSLGPGEMVVVPQGVEHRPVAREEVHLLLVETAGIKHTGEVQDERTVSEYQWI
jgi:mannose-6-phosphate isomerase-like protein (cupin superfamily)